jgi:hypothetical protein
VEIEGILHRPAHPANHPRTAEAVTTNSPASAPCPNRGPNRFPDKVWLDVLRRSADENIAQPGFDVAFHLLVDHPEIAPGVESDGGGLGFDRGEIDAREAPELA